MKLTRWAENMPPKAAIEGTTLTAKDAVMLSAVASLMPDVPDVRKGDFDLFTHDHNVGTHSRILPTRISFKALIQL
jgi:hypothetical protein